MWTEQLTRVDDNTFKLSLYCGGRPASFQRVIDGWQSEPDFADFFSRLLAGLTFEAFFWEMPPLLSSSLAEDFHCVFVDSPALVSVSPEPEVFEQYFCAAKEGVTGFQNIGGDAWLLAPAPLSSDTNYAHIADFVRCAPLAQQIALWRQLGHHCQQRLGDEPLWLNTSGLGVHWLHLRFDRYPKYYTYDPYRELT